MACTSCCAGARRSERRRRAAAWLLALAAGAALPPALAAGTTGTDANPTAAPARDEARCLLQQGQLRLALDGLRAAHAAAAAGVERRRAAAALGRAWLGLQQHDDAARVLTEATQDPALPAPEQAAALMDLGRAEAARGQPAAADQAWRDAAAALPADRELALSAELNRLRLRPAPDRLPALPPLLDRVDALPDATSRARLLLNAAAQARDAGPAGAALAWRGYDQGRRQAEAARDDRLAAEAYDGLAALYADAGRADEALALAERGVVHAARVDARDLLMALEGRVGRLAQGLGRDELSLQAYRRAVGHVEAVRSDIPVRYVDGRSSFRETLEPLYLGLTDQLLRRAAQRDGGEREALLRQARDTVELIKQTELEDYLRDRCSVGSAARRVSAPPPGVALHYPILLPDRVELLVETAAGIERRSVAVGAEQMRDRVLAFVAALRGGNPLRARAEALYRVLVAPIDPVLSAQHIHTLVTVPDGVLRLLPLGALHDGRGWLLQRMAVATAPGLSLTAAPRDSGQPLQALLAGVSVPGPVVGKLSADVVETVLDPQADARAAGRQGRREALPLDPARQRELRQALSLPGVKDEIEAIARLVPGTVLLDRQFTLEALRRSLAEQRPPIVHIASHGVFGDSADTTFIMTYDELLTLDALQALLRGEGRGATPIEVLTLSACQTAEGDDRAPLGMSGTALKARARTALGTLWPVSDEAANRVMQGFYRRLAAGGIGRAEALRQAQLELLRTPRRDHPTVWAPFILIGDWR